MNVLQELSEMLERARELPLIKIVTVFVLSYPIIFLILFSSEISQSILSDKVSKKRDTHLLAVLHSINTKFGAKGLVLYKYQPNEGVKTSKKLSFYASNTGNAYRPVSNFQLVSQSEVMTAYNTCGYYRATQESKMYFAGILGAYGLKTAYFIPIRDVYGAIIGEYILIDPETKDVSEMLNQAKVIYYNLSL